VTTVDQPAVRFAHEMLDVFVEAGWPAHGVYRALPANVASTGLFVAVQDGNSPSEERRLLLALSEFGMYAVKSTSPKLTHPKALELLVGQVGLVCFGQAAFFGVRIHIEALHSGLTGRLSLIENPVARHVGPVFQLCRHLSQLQGPPREFSSHALVGDMLASLQETPRQVS